MNNFEGEASKNFICVLAGYYIFYKLREPFIYYLAGLKKGPLWIEWATKKDQRVFLARPEAISVKYTSC